MSDWTAMDQRITENDADLCYRLILGRPVDNPALRDELVKSGLTVRELVARLVTSDEHNARPRAPAAERPRKPWGNLDAPALAQDVDALFEILLGRSVGDDSYRSSIVDGQIPLRDLLKTMLNSLELKQLNYRAFETEHTKGLADSGTYRCPTDLQLAALPTRRVLFVGSCLSQVWSFILAKPPFEIESDEYFLGAELPDAPARPIAHYDFQIVQPALRAVLPDSAFARLSQLDAVGHERLFDYATNKLQLLLADGMKWNVLHGILTFVFSFPVPQQNAVGRLLPRYDLRNPVYFIEKLNEALAREQQKYPNSYFFDLNELTATHGKRFVQEDAVAALNHGAFVADFDSQFDRNRLEHAPSVLEVYETRETAIVSAGWHEIFAMVRTIRQADLVKLVVIDLDDTLWRGVIAESDPGDLPTNEGWPMALWETLLFLKRRGILLAIISKNEEENVLKSWEEIVGQHLSLDDFAIRRINWRPKSENMAEILQYVNLLPKNVVFIDDNPANRSEMQTAFPEIRVLGGSPLRWRHILLWSAETQSPTITAESAARTDMVRAQVVREETRLTLPKSEFLASLNVEVVFARIERTSHPRFPRVIELINKTNQFNTSGRRWTEEECAAAMHAGAAFYAFDVSDSFTRYGLVGVLIVRNGVIDQFVMSCRIMGLEAELAAVAQIVVIERANGAGTVSALISETPRNVACRDVYSRCGFDLVDGVWTMPPTRAAEIPPHIRMLVQEDALA